VVALIGIILLIGIVKKNGIMMVDFALDGERNHGKEFDRCNLRGLSASLPAHYDDHNGCVAPACPWRWEPALAPNYASPWASPWSVDYC